MSVQRVDKVLQVGPHIAPEGIGLFTEPGEEEREEGGAK